VAERDHNHRPLCPVKESGSAKHNRMSTLAVNTMQGLSCTNVLAATPYHGTSWYRKSCCANGRSDEIGAVATMKCAKHSKPSRIGRDARHQGPRSGLRQRGPFEKFAAVPPTSYRHVQAPSCARYAPGEENGESAECFYTAWDTWLHIRSNQCTLQMNSITLQQMEELGVLFKS